MRQVEKRRLEMTSGGQKCTNGGRWGVKWRTKGRNDEWIETGEILGTWKEFGDESKRYRKGGKSK